MNDIGQSDRILAAVVTVPTKTNDTIGLNSILLPVYAAV